MKRPKTVKEAMELPVVYPWKNEYVTEYFETTDLLEFLDSEGTRWQIVKTKEGYGRTPI